MKDQKENICEEDLRKAGVGSGDQQDRHPQWRALPEERRGQGISMVGSPQTIRIPDFRRDLCIDPTELAIFSEKYCWSDFLIIDPGRRVMGKGLNDELRDCHIYISRGDARYTFDLGEEGDNKDIFHKIPENMKLVIIGDGKKVFAALPEYDDEMLIYKLGNDVGIELYFETDLYKGKFNLFYGYIWREPRCCYGSCVITGDPRIGETLFKSFARTVNTGREEALARAAKMI